MEQIWNPARLILGFVVLFAIFVPLERLVPIVRRQFWQRPGVRADLAHFFISGALRKLLTLVFAYVLITLLGFLVHPPLQQWLAERPRVLQFAIALVVYELGAYWGHRLAHTVPFLWRFHAVHHSSEHLDWLAAARVHPVDQTFIRLCGILPVYFLGFTAATFGFLIAVDGLLAVFIHANVRLRFGWLEWLVASPAYHHWHHANEGPATANKNFGGLLPAIDALFGTLHLPKRLPHRYGIDEPMPETYVGQLAQPFAARKAGAGAAPVCADETAVKTVAAAGPDPGL
jgi:sterol desaturase/sphingolipid hydroxylase (fatty acid hydroxylase superfamily)